MHVAEPRQKFQDWFTQQWNILRGKKITPDEVPWLMGPFGNLNGIGEAFIHQLAEKENLKIVRYTADRGLLPSIHQLNLSEEEFSRLSKEVIHFYEHTATYQLEFNIKWNPFFKVFGSLVNRLFSRRIHQLYLPTKKAAAAEPLNSELVALVDPKSNKTRYTIWLRTFVSSGEVVFSGVYGTCTLPSGKTCVKAVFPLPKGNATVIMIPVVQNDGSLKLVSSGKKFGDAGFYFLLQDSKGNYWSQYIRSFHDSLTIGCYNGVLQATQHFKLWNKHVLSMNYKIEEKKK